MQIKFKYLIIFPLLMAFMAITTLSNESLAENRWIIHTSPTGVFSVRIPNEYEIKNETLHISEETIAQAGELISTIDQRPYKEVVKNYIVKYDQTIGGALTAKEKSQIIDHDLELYVQHYESLGGEVKKIEKRDYEDDAEGELYITYPDEKMGEQGLRVYITFSDITKFQQIMTGPTHVMYVFETKDFFESLNIKNGITKSENKLKDTWTPYDSPFELFSLHLPPVSEIFHPQEPRIEHNNNTEVIGSYFYDPIRKQQLFYKVFGYRTGANVNSNEAKKIMYFQHAAKYLSNPQSLKFDSSKTEDGTPIIETEYNITPPKSFPYIQTIKLRAMYKGPYIIVQEIMGSDTLANSTLTRTLTDLVEFTPERAHALIQNKLQP